MPVDLPTSGTDAEVRVLPNGKAVSIEVDEETVLPVSGGVILDALGIPADLPAGHVWRGAARLCDGQPVRVQATRGIRANPAAPAFARRRLSSDQEVTSLEEEVDVMEIIGSSEDVAAARAEFDDARKRLDELNGPILAAREATDAAGIPWCILDVIVISLRLLRCPEMAAEAA